MDKQSSGALSGEIKVVFQNITHCKILNLGQNQALRVMT